MIASKLKKLDDFCILPNNLYNYPVEYSRGCGDNLTSMYIIRLYRKLKTEGAIL